MGDSIEKITGYSFYQSLLATCPQHERHWIRPEQRIQASLLLWDDLSEITKAHLPPDPRIPEVLLAEIPWVEVSPRTSGNQWIQRLEEAKSSGKLNRPLKRPPGVCSPIFSGNSSWVQPRTPAP